MMGDIFLNLISLWELKLLKIENNKLITKHKGCDLCHLASLTLPSTALGTLKASNHTSQWFSVALFLPGTFRKGEEALWMVSQPRSDLFFFFT